ncbi:MAG: hypothetical protein QOF01_2263 [Thermomicrobiales bacterium]|nr:hypothetical protein [Thermomicrobiales bacterium]
MTAAGRRKSRGRWDATVAACNSDRGVQRRSGRHLQPPIGRIRPVPVNGRISAGQRRYRLRECGVGFRGTCSPKCGLACLACDEATGNCRSTCKPCEICTSGVGEIGGCYPVCSPTCQRCNERDNTCEDTCGPCEFCDTGGRLSTPVRMGRTATRVTPVRWRDVAPNRRGPAAKPTTYRASPTVTVPAADRKSDVVRIPCPPTRGAARRTSPAPATPAVRPTCRRRGRSRKACSAARSTSSKCRRTVPRCPSRTSSLIVQSG